MATRVARASLHGVLVLDKPGGPTSHDVVARLRRLLRTRAVGHAGTLDPMATGVLVACVGEATKLSPYLTSADKTYEATVALGASTDTLDACGTVTLEATVAGAVREALRRFQAGEVVPVLRGALDQEHARELQVPPVYSAIQEDGERAHDRARRGEAFELPARPVKVRRIELLAVSPEADEPHPWLSFSLTVAKGYYVRAFARDFAAALGTVGHLTALRRTRSGVFRVSEAVPLEGGDVPLAARLLSPADAACLALPHASLSVLGEVHARCGRRVPREELVFPEASPPPKDGGPDEPAPLALLGAGGALVAIASLEPDGARILRGFPVLGAGGEVEAAATLTS